MEDFEVKFKAKIWIYEGPTPWYMITVPLNVSTIIKKRFGHLHRGWGSIPVIVGIGESSWKTSIFWEKKGTYLLPIKKQIRVKEKITNGDIVEISLLIQNVGL
ncbi:MAG: hypothetical protein ACD_37C00065G0005 [uncultured bacterium]|nr:MAG: hypothetical protein ACD_37C00065G0005 [uncultured bacterium]